VFEATSVDGAGDDAKDPDWLGAGTITGSLTRPDPMAATPATSARRLAAAAK
jgi:hypothetical protein